MTACAVVVLPQPDSPTSATSSPAATVSEMPSTARTTRSSRRATVPTMPARQRIVDDEVVHGEQGGAGAHAAEPAARWHAARWCSPTASSGGRTLGAGLERRVAARSERARHERAVEARRRARNRGDAAGAGQVGRRGEQHARVRMPRRVVQLRRRAALGDAARVHHRRRLAGLRDDREVVRDQHDREAEIVGELREELEDLRLHHHVERRRGLVGEQHARIARERHGDGRALAHAARELVREAPRALGADADELEQLAAAGSRGAPARLVVQLHRLDDLVADALHGVERVHRALEHHRDVAPAVRPHGLLAAARGCPRRPGGRGRRRWRCAAGAP